MMLRILLRAALAGACALAVLAPARAGPLPEGARLLRDQAYGAAPRQRFDVYLPAGPSGPVLFLVNDGGDKAAAGVADAKARHWLARGYVLVSTNHRARPQFTIHAQLEDVSRALAQAQAAARGWGADPARFVLMGQGAGAHLVGLLNTQPAPALSFRAQPWRAAVALASPAMDVVATMEAPHDKALDALFGQDPAAWPAISPRHQLHKALSPPLLMVCSLKRKGACDQALDYEKSASVFHQRITIWQQQLAPRDVGARLGQAGPYTDSVTAWIAAMAGG